MYEDNNTYDDIVTRSLARVSTNVDKREGSIVFNAIAPTSEEIAELYVLLDAILENGFADTAEREYLILRCAERGIIPYPATKAELKLQTNIPVDIGTRYSLGELTYIITGSLGENLYTVECEQAGTDGNRQFGAVEALDYTEGDFEGEITELIAPARDEEDTEDLRLRYFNSFKATAFGGNRAQYLEYVNAITGVGATRVIPCVNGAGTVGIRILNTEYLKASDALIAEVQEELDPTQDGTGAGIAPIGHRVYVSTCTPQTVNVALKLTIEEGYTWDKIKSTVTAKISSYLAELRKNWGNEDGNTIVRVSQIDNRVLSIDGVVDVTGTKINGTASNLSLTGEYIPIIGGVTNA